MSAKTWCDVHREYDECVKPEERVAEPTTAERIEALEDEVAALKLHARIWDAHLPRIEALLGAKPAQSAAASFDGHASYAKTQVAMIPVAEDWLRHWTKLLVEAPLSASGPLASLLADTLFRNSNPPHEVKTVPEAYNIGLTHGASAERERIARLYEAGPHPAPAIAKFIRESAP